MIVSVRKSREIARVREDIAAGRHRVAVRRLQTLAAINCRDQNVNRLLVDLYRQAGDLASAGRWGFLTDTVTEGEISAFARQHPSPWVRLRLLRWSGDPAEVPCEAGRLRLQRLIEEAERSPEPTSPAPAPYRAHIPTSRQPSAVEALPVGSAGAGAAATGSPRPPERTPESDSQSDRAAAPLTRRQFRKARRRAERLRRRALRREVRASTFVSVFMLAILVALGVLGSLGAVHSMQSVIEHLASLLIS